MNARRLGLCFAALLTSVVLAGCDPSAVVDTKNTTTDTYIVRFEPEDEDVANFTVSYTIPPMSAGISQGGMIYVGWRGNAVVMSDDCQVVARLQVTSDDSFLEITDAGATIREGRSGDIEVKPFPETEECQ